MLIGHPQLPAAVSRLIEVLIRTYDGNRLLNQLLCDRGRVVFGYVVCYLAVSPTSGSAGVTLGAVQAICRLTGLCSAGRAAAMLAAMRFGGYVVAETDPGDGRKRRLMPSDKLLAEQCRQWTHHYEAMLPVLPRAAEVLPRIRDRNFYIAMQRQLGQHYLAGFRMLDQVPALAPLAESNAGLLIMAGLMNRHMNAGGRGEPIPVSISAIARRFGVARSHVRHMLLLAETGGLLTRSTDRSVIVLPALTQAVLRFFAVLFLWFDGCGARALAEMRDDPPGRP